MESFLSASIKEKEYFNDGHVDVGGQTVICIISGVVEAAEHRQDYCDMHVFRNVLWLMGIVD